MQDKSTAAQPSSDAIRWALDHPDRFRPLVDLAHAICETQYEAVLNKLSRAYQKPDFCVRRDSVGSDCDQFLPVSLSWDADWYYGPTDFKSSSPAQTPVKVDSVTESSDKGAKV
jgi:predicted metalloprotease